MSKSLAQFRKGTEFTAYAEAQGWDVRNCSGSHRVVTFPDGTKFAIPEHGELGKGLRCKILKKFLAFTLAAAAAVLLVILGGIPL